METRAFWVFAGSQGRCCKQAFGGPSDPQRADLRTFAALWLTPVVLIAMGALFLTLQGLSMLGVI